MRQGLIDNGQKNRYLGEKIGQLRRLLLKRCIDGCEYRVFRIVAGLRVRTTRRGQALMPLGIKGRQIELHEIQ